jgi:hypothetical protein
LQGPGLPFADVLSEAQIDEAMRAEGVCFGESERAVYTPAITLWAFLSQVLQAGPLRSCTAAVARVIVLLVALGREPCSADSGEYCRARAKLPEAVIRRLALDVGHQLEARVPADWLWLGRHVKVADGTTLTMPDTPANQQAYPQQRGQKPGLGFPILRMVVLLSMATAALCGMALAPYAGKQTGETALLRSLFDLLEPGDVLVGDRHFGSYFLVAMGRKRGVDWVARLHQARHVEVRRGQCIGREDRQVVWHRPQRPEWMDEATYATMPEKLTLREILVEVHVPGFRVKRLVLVTTLTDTRRYPTQAIAQLYRARWHVELDLRAIKQSLGIEPLRCKSPEMVRKEIWTHGLAYNLIRKTIAQAALAEGRLPREISFAGARQMIAASWDLLSRTPQALDALARVLFPAIASHPVGDRPDRVEPRAVKRRPKPHRLLQKPRAQARAELLRSRRPHR